MSYTVEQYEHCGIQVTIENDDDPMSPRGEFENTDHMICFHSEYTLGDKHSLEPEELVALLKKPNIIWLPLYLYDHSGITMYTTGNKDYHQHKAWDTSNIGAIYMTIGEARKCFDPKRKMTREDLIERACESMKASVKIYDQYLTGEVYGYIVEGDYRWGYYDLEQCKDEASRMAEYIYKERLQKKLKKTKAQIMNRVPLLKRV